VRRGLKLALSITDIAFLLYWAVAGLDTAGLIHLPTDWLYPNAHDPRVVAWNWSFFPLDIAFSITGLWAVRASSRGQAIWRPMALISLILTMVAGGMACGYWLLIGEIDPTWFGMNLLLLVWPVLFLPRLIRDLASNASAT
jgi:hypothetical protein